MLKRYATFVSLFRALGDSFMIACLWLSVFFLRFHTGIIQAPKGIPQFKEHLFLMLPVVCIYALSCLLTGLYRPKRVVSMLSMLWDISKATLFAAVFVLAFFYYIQDVPYSRKLLALFALMSFVGLMFSHLVGMALVRELRRKGYNIRHYAVIGTGPKAQQLVRDIEKMDWLGLKCAFFIDDDPKMIGTKLLDIPVHGPVEKLPLFVNSQTVDEIYLTLTGTLAQKAYKILQKLQSTGITIRIIPDWGNLAATTRPTAFTVGSQVLFSANDSPLTGTNIVIKELFDRLLAATLLIILAVPFVIIALIIKLTSKGPVFYKQARIGMDQKRFRMLKFRTMKLNAEDKTGPKWAKPDDPRCTHFGAWLRRNSIDELPQLLNVLMGSMSLVGPRPERPHFTKKFSEEYKKYMFRHKVKAGMTGWAQINGFRGDTSLRKRLLYDLYYVRNWSFGLDLWILLKTPWHILKGENAY